ncbi:MAG TPA: hypothetical protein VMW84_03195 [Acidobacteriota bacterium]|nr:hypothetical protein [Acidobacteriota bacterium]
MYSAWIKIDDSLPWIELEGAFQTKAAAQEALKERRSKVKIKIVKMSKQEKQIKATIRLRH